MIRRILFPFVVGAIMLILVASIVSAIAASNTVTSSNLSDTSRGIGANDLKPSQCATLTLDTIYACPAHGPCNGPTGNVLLLGPSGNKKINGNSGDDCIIAGSGSQTINGGGGTNICIGNSGDTYSNCILATP